MNAPTDVVVAGVGTSDFGKQDLDALALVSRAVEEALADAGVTRADLDAIYVGTVFSYPGTAHRALRAAGIAGIPIYTVENACASGTLAVHLASEAVRLGVHRCVLAVGFEKMTGTIKGAIPTDPGDPEALAGMQLPSIYAMSATRYMDRYGLTREQLAHVSVKNHAHAMGNPRAQYRGEYTVEDVLSSRAISDPLTILQCCAISDGAAAAVVRPAADHRGSPAVRVVATGFASGAPWPGPDPDTVWNYELIQRTAADTLGRAGWVAAEVDVAEVHDAFTIGEIVTVEALGFCAPGEGGSFTAAGETTLGGSIPVNPSGGLLSRGHPLGATGVAQVAEITWQLTGRAGDRQVAGASRGLVETMGGSASALSGNGCVVLALETT